MENKESRDLSFEAEREKYRRDLASLEQTEGFGKLTPRQQQIIRVSLYLQARAERDMHPEHKNDPWYYDWFKSISEFKPGYQECLHHIQEWYCHAAIASLESGSLQGMHPQPHPKKFFDAEYFEFKCEYDLERMINYFGFPTVVHINSKPANFVGEESQYHSFLALGYGPTKSILVWEKNGFNFPYRVVNLEEVYEEYQSFRYWGLRKLR